ncbi:penicillin acylase family protein [Sphingomonas japonica]|uniref:Acyl-homoserine-lactone acylase n=1 Tax=Sphingomonas japonica TaxID=511662 RepID=A0ABX0TWL1_9SPHN|nr:penicillin acylase family protein [Sphingomonas japonica]NIJ22711.1 acyl-homoserine-lactone acylase [Sphingomonas japonica]
MGFRSNAGAVIVLLGAVAPPLAAAPQTPDHAARVTIARDARGIAHVHGQSDADAVFGMIYAQAEDDFPRIERNYLVALGRLAEAEGETALWQDVRQRLYIDEADLRRDYAASPPWLRTLMDAWAGGLNHYLATHRDVRPRVLTRFEPWMALAFSEGSIGGDIERGIDLRALAELYGDGRVQVASADRWRMREPQGSNGIAIAAPRTRDGKALLLINPHTSFYFRSEAQVTSDAGLDVYGASTWGQFFVYQGFNPRLGWMHTSSGVDNIDEFTETVAHRGGRLEYRYGSEWRGVEERPIVVRVRQSDGSLAQRSFTTLATHHGPIIRREGGKLIAVAMLDSPRAALEQSFLRTKAATIDAFVDISDRKANSSNNTIVAAADGSIGYLHPQFVPVRDDRFDYRKPVDGSDPATDWKGLHPLNTLPSVVRPASGWVANSNNWPWSVAGRSSPNASAYPRYMDQEGENPRGIHATRMLAADDALTPGGLQRLAYDPALPLFETQVPWLKRGFDALPAADPRRARLAGPVAMLDSWDKRWSTTSEATTLAVMWGEALWEQEGPKAAAASMPLFQYWDERTTDAARLDALDTALARIQRDWGGWRVAWGRVNRFQRLDGAIAPRFDDGRPSFPVGFTSGNFGSLAAFGVEWPQGQRCAYGTSGNSFVAVVEFGAKTRAWAVSAGGESGDPASPHFDDQAALYAAGQMRPVLLDAAEVAKLPSYRPGEKRPASIPVAHVPEPTTRCGEP